MKKTLNDIKPKGHKGRSISGLRTGKSPASVAAKVFKMKPSQQVKKV